LPAIFTYYGQNQMLPANYLRCPQDFEKYGTASDESTTRQLVELALQRNFNEIYGSLSFDMSFVSGLSLSNKVSGNWREMTGKGKKWLKLGKYTLFSFLLASSIELLVEANLKNADLHELHEKFNKILFNDRSDKSFAESLLPAILKADKYFLSQEGAEQKYFEFTSLLAALMSYMEKTEEQRYVISLSEARSELKRVFSLYTNNNDIVANFHRSICEANRIQNRHTPIEEYWAPGNRLKNSTHRRVRTKVLSSLRKIIDEGKEILQQRERNLNDLIRFLQDEKIQLGQHFDSVEETIAAETMLKEKMDFYTEELRSTYQLRNSEFLNKESMYRFFTNFLLREHQENPFAANWDYVKQDIQQTYNCPL
ncbi:MAG: hypothetical protein KDD40_09065, partial [Bdellovibrionales bacterium]|nr:hypothetical protein [Bdellovibrionales bacterium]